MQGFLSEEDLCELGAELLVDGMLWHDWVIHREGYSVYVKEWPAELVARTHWTFRGRNVLARTQSYLLDDVEMVSAQQRKVEWVMGYLDAMGVAKDTAELNDGFKDSEWANDYPALHEFMTAAWHKGKRRELSRLTLFVEDDKVKAFLNCEGGAKYTCISADSVYAVLGVLEGKLASGEAEWREPKKYGRGK